MPFSSRADACPVVWIVDDSSTESEAIRSALAPSCDIASFFSDGTALIEALSHRILPDVLVLDWQMPGMSGIEVCQFLRGNQATMALPVLLLTAHQGPEDVAEGLAAGANDYVFKPFRPVELVARVRALARWDLLRKKNEQVTTLTQRSLRDEHARRVQAEGSLTALQVAEERARRMEQRYQLAARATQDVIWEWEPRTDRLELSGGNQALVGGLEPGPVSLSWWAERIHPEDRERVLRGFRMAMEGLGLEWQDEYRFQHRDGTWAEVMDRAFIVRDSHGRAVQVVGALQDITERKRAEVELRRSEERNRAVLAALAEGVIVQDAQGVLRLANASAERLLGRSFEQLAGRRSTDPHWRAVRGDGSPYPGEEHAPMRAVRTGQPQHDEVLGIHHADGRLVWLSVNAQPLFEADGRTPAGVVSSFFDISERMQAETEARRRAEFEQQLIGIVSHDLRSPLNAITLAAATLLRRGGQDERQASAISRIIASAGRASRMIHDLLDFTQARLGGGLPIQPGPCDLSVLSRQVVDEVQLSHSERQVEVVVGGDTRGTWDEDRMAQLVGNLLGNALTYSAPETPVRVELQGEDGWVVLSVHNAGAPIPAELLPRLFEPLRRGERTAGKEHRSIGLGLFIVKQVVDVHGGHIGVHSAEGEGTTFTVRLPRQPPEARA
jgi:PAS domain S-box-containing protein